MIDILAKLRELEAAGWLRMKDPAMVSSALLGAIGRAIAHARAQERSSVTALLEHLVCIAASDPRRIVTQEYLAWLQGAWPGVRARVVHGDQNAEGCQHEEL